MTNFLKYTALFEAAVLIIAIGGTAWPYVNPGL